jgi:hypothetical protein
VLEALTAESPLVLWLEDLHWSDLSTVDALAMLARRREPARLLVVGTYRPAEGMASGHPLRALVRELEAHAQCRGLPLRFLTPTEVTQYLAARFAPSPEAEAEACFIRAIDIARRQGARLFELRAVMSLGRLQLRQAGRRRLEASLRRYMAGSPRASTRKTCRRPGRCWRPWLEMGFVIQPSVQNDRSQVLSLRELHSMAIGLCVVGLGLGAVSVCAEGQPGGIGGDTPRR